MKKANEKDYRRCGPYSFMKRKDGSHVCLNREHFPINRSDYSISKSDPDYVNKIEKEYCVSFSEDEIKLIKYSGNEDTFFLYNDSCAPWLNTKSKSFYNKKLNFLEGWGLLI